MLTAEEAVQLLLTRDTDVTALQGDRVYPGQAQQGATLPYSVVTDISEQHDKHMGGASGALGMLLQVESYAVTYTAVKALAEAIRIALQGFMGTVTNDGATDSVVINGIILEGGGDMPSAPGDDSRMGPRGVRRDYMVRCREPIP